MLCLAGDDGRRDEDEEEGEEEGGGQPQMVNAVRLLKVTTEQGAAQVAE